MDAISLERRLLLIAPPDRIPFQAWGNLPPESGEMAKLYGDINEPGPLPGYDEVAPRLVQRAAQLRN